MPAACQNPGNVSSSGIVAGDAEHAGRGKPSSADGTGGSIDTHNGCECASMLCKRPLPHDGSASTFKAEDRSMQTMVLGSLMPQRICFRLRRALSHLAKDAAHLIQVASILNMRCASFFHRVPTASCTLTCRKTSRTACSGGGGESRQPWDGMAGALQSISAFWRGRGCVSSSCWTVATCPSCTSAGCEGRR